MKVRCLRQYPTEEQVQALGPAFYRKQSFHLTVGREYLVFGLQLSVNANMLGTGAWIQIVSESERLSWAPLMLFEIVDPRVSRYWEVRHWPDGAVTLWPNSFYRDYFHDDLSEGVPDLMKEFAAVRASLESEFEPGMRR